MEIQVHSIHFDADQKLIDFIHEKVNKLEQFFDNIVAAEVFLRLENDKDMENKIAEIKLSIPGKVMFAKRKCKSFEEAVDLSSEALRRQIRKYKGKLRVVAQ
mgnify:CR=1 FL=1